LAYLYSSIAARQLRPKDAVLIPQLLALALQMDGWIVRSEIIWAKRNCMPESVTDRPTKSHEQIWLLSKSPRYFFDQEAVREPHTPDGRKKLVHDHAVNGSHENYANMGTAQERWPNGGRNIRSVWEIATQPYPEAHFATFPEALPERCIKAGTSERGCCPECGAPWQREVERESSWDARKEAGATRGNVAFNGNVGAGTQRGVHGAGISHDLGGGAVKTLGWRPTCGHDREPVPCTVLDVFMGSGTTAYVARKLGRRAVGIELNEEYAQLAARRLQQQSLFAQEDVA
jgi:hypothetical protein